MGVKVYDYVGVTGLSNSGTTDATGSWNTVTLSSFVTPPTGASGVLIFYNNGTNAGSRWLGIKTTGKTNAILQTDSSPQNGSMLWVALNESGQFDLYCEDATTAKFYILAVADASWVWNDVDGTLPTIPLTVTYGVKTASVATGTKAILGRSSVTSWAWRPVGTGTTITSQSGTEVVGIDTNKQFEGISSSAVSLEVLAEIRDGFTTGSWPPAAETPTVDGTWRDSTLSIPAGQSLALIRRTTITNSAWWKWRKKAGTFDPSTTQFSGYTSLRAFAPVDANGNFEYNVESTATGDHTLTGYFSDVASAGLTITSITPSQIDSGESFTIAGTGFGSTQGLSLVQIGGVTQTPTSWSDSSITCTATRGSQSMGNATLTIYKM